MMPESIRKFLGLDETSPYLETDALGRKYYVIEKLNDSGVTARERRAPTML